jgi:hypothetical protein
VRTEGKALAPSRSLLIPARRLRLSLVFAFSSPPPTAYVHVYIHACVRARERASPLRRGIFLRLNPAY